MVVRVRRKAAVGELDAPAVEELAVGRDGDEHRRVTVLGDADGRAPPWTYHQGSGRRHHGASVANAA
jgi:hypothetical protein